MRSPHLLNAASNVREMHSNLAAILDPVALGLIKAEIERNAIQLAQLGIDHYNFARSVPRAQWRQIISRSYYGAYNMSRAARFLTTGVYTTDNSDHKKIGELPPAFPNVQRYANQLKALRDDRNLCDYDHTATEGDLIIPMADVLTLVGDLVSDLRIYFQTYGVVLP